ncbi:TPA: transposase [Streptococcus pyogenes]|nr:transposase [Streptococcus pyogenes]HEP2206199.1 transposase [Streptococcus pyogenes]HEP2351459.1 transposase [Streptococcus pyogenes]HEQ8311639.1 transposase [Streptococcus pyogenes]HEQ8413430.1 transposase [Streptococcus pyogenes]
MIKAIFYEHKERYGSVRITQELCRRGIMSIINVLVDSFIS